VSRRWGHHVRQVIVIAIINVWLQTIAKAKTIGFPLAIVYFFTKIDVVGENSTNFYNLTDMVGTPTTAKNV